LRSSYSPVDAFEWRGNASGLRPGQPERAGRFRQTLDREPEERFERIMRARGELPPGNYPYFRDPPVHVVLLETGPDGSCEYAIERTPDHEAILCFLSPVDAMMEGILRAKPGLRYKVQPAAQVAQHYFLTLDHCLTLTLHLAWLASDGRVLVRGSGAPCRLFRALRKDASQGMPVRFEVDADSLDEADYLYERAGLLAWEEMHRDHHRDEQTAIAGIRAARVTPKPAGLEGSRADLALFDPESRQWHFLPQDSAPAEGED